MIWRIRMPDGSAIALERHDIFLGSDSSCDIVIDDAQPKNVRLSFVAGRWFIESIDDAQLYVNDRPQSKSFLNPNDQFSMESKGDRYVIECVEAADPSPVHSSRAKLDRRPPHRTEHGINYQTYVATLLAALLAVVSIVLLVGRGRETTTADQQVIVDATPDNEELQSVQRSTNETDVSIVPPLAALSSESEQYVNPLDVLVLVGIAHGETDSNDPVVTGIGWLMDSKSVVVPNELARFLEKALASLHKSGETSQHICVIQGQPIRAESIRHLESCPKISIIVLAKEAILPGRVTISPLTAAEFELRRRREKFNYLSYLAFNREKKLDPPLVGAYDSEEMRIGKGNPTLRFTNQLHVLESAQLSDDSGTHQMERGGILTDRDGKICGMCLPDSTIIWGNELQSLR